VLELELFPTVHSVARCGVRVVTYGVMGSDLRGEKREAETERERERNREREIYSFLPYYHHQVI
jgi:hypothetical protein